MHTMPRRVFLRGVVRVLVCTGLAAACGLARLRGRGGAVSELKGRLSRMFSDPEQARAVGMAYLARNPEGRRQASALAAALAAADPDRPDELCALLRRRREGDFRADRIVVLDGWILSATEAHSCALVSLL
ncbi:MAG: hypothetical protein ACE5FL_09295 [Myxococcota bacterium]